MGMCALDLLVLRWFMKPLYLSNRKLQKQTIKEVLFSRINRKRVGQKSVIR